MGKGKIFGCLLCVATLLGLGTLLGRPTSMRPILGYSLRSGSAPLAADPLVVTPAPTIGSAPLPNGNMLKRVDYNKILDPAQADTSSRDSSSLQKSAAVTTATLVTTPLSSSSASEGGALLRPWFGKKGIAGVNGEGTPTSIRGSGSSSESSASVTASANADSGSTLLAASSSANNASTTTTTSTTSPAPATSTSKQLFATGAAAAGQNADPTHANREDAFERIYKHNLWSPEGSGSGPGSRIDATVGLRQHLHDVIKRESIQIMLDIPCGAMEWTEVFLREVWKYNKDFQYIGVDIAQTPLDRARQRFVLSPEENAKVSLLKADLSVRPPGSKDIVTQLSKALDGAEQRLAAKAGGADGGRRRSRSLASPLAGASSSKKVVALTRDALQHLSIASACQFVSNIQEATVKSGHVLDTWLIGHYPRGQNVQGAIDGGLIDNNMAKWPYQLGQPKAVLRERGYLPAGAPTKNLAVFRPAQDWASPDFKACAPLLQLLRFLHQDPMLPNSTPSGGHRLLGRSTRDEQIDDDGRGGQTLPDHVDLSWPTSFSLPAPTNPKRVRSLLVSPFRKSDAVGAVDAAQQKSSGLDVNEVAIATASPSEHDRTQKVEDREGQK